MNEPETVYAVIRGRATGTDQLIIAVYRDLDVAELHARRATAAVTTWRGGAPDAKQSREAVNAYDPTYFAGGLRNVVYRIRPVPMPLHPDQFMEANGL